LPENSLTVRSGLSANRLEKAPAHLLRVPRPNIEMKSEKMRENAKNKEKIKETEIYFNFNAKSA
jgi:hypothetical protein